MIIFLNIFSILLNLKYCTGVLWFFIFFYKKDFLKVSSGIYYSFVRYRALVKTTILCKIFWEKLRNQAKLGKIEKLWYLFLVLFERCSQKFIYSGEVWRKAVSPCSFGVFLIFPYFLRSQVLSRLATCVATCI